MSLYVGNISSRIHRDELEGVFQRFGRCDVRMKDGYGFVVYELPPNAEKALRALQNRSICGEPLTLSWSNKQPRPFKRFSRPARTYEPWHGRDSMRGGDYVKRKRGSNDWKDYTRGSKQPDGNGGKLSPVEMLDEETACQRDEIKDYVGEGTHADRGDFLDEGGRAEPNAVDNDRWGDQFCDPSEENGKAFDRYEPYQGFEGKIDDENHQMTYSGVSSKRSSQENVGRDYIGEMNLNQPNDSKFKNTCYKCGGSGHKMYNCPQESSLRRKFTRFDCRHAVDFNRSRGKGDLKRFGSSSQEKRQSTMDVVPTRRLKYDRKSFGAGKHKKMKSPDVKNTGESHKRDYGRKKRSRKEIRSPNAHSPKKARRPVLSHLYYDYIASRLQSTSQSKHVERSRSHSRSRTSSSRAHSLSSDSRSSSTSQYSKSKSFKSKSRSSSPTSLSFSVSLGRPLPSSSNKAQVNLKGSSDNAKTPESKEILNGQIQLGEGDTGLEDANLEKKMVTANKENEVSLFKAENEAKNGEPLQKDTDEYKLASKLLPEVMDPNTRLPEKRTLAADCSSPEMLIEVDCQNSDPLMMEHEPIQLKKPDLEAPINSYSRHSTSISSEELHRVLKHYGLNIQDENEGNLTPEACFGCARFWPWEIIFYRRLKKGPISIENYAKRVDQNREFGIADKYIRSSSGWGETGQENI